MIIAGNHISKPSNEESKRAVVIGGGILGVSILYHLAQNGWRDVVLIEKSALTSGSTWHSSGDLGFSLDDPLHLWFVNYSASLYQRFKETSGNRVGWHRTGGLRMAYNRAEVQAFDRFTQTACELGLNLEVITPTQLSKLHPFFDHNGVKACLYSPFDGHVDPHGATMMMAEEARRMGARILCHSRVTEVTRCASGNWRVDTETTDCFTADHVILACGCYTPQIGAWFGLRLPVYSFLHHYFVTEAIAEFSRLEKELPIVRDERCGGYIRQEQKSLLIGTSENCNPVMVWKDMVPWQEESTLFDADYDAVAHLLGRAMEKFPILTKTGIKKAIRGAVTYTPDGRMLLGPAGGYGNLWVAAGASSGIAWGGGIGKCLADLITYNHSPVSIQALAPDRFAAEQEKILQERATHIFLTRGATKLAAHPVHSEGLI
jgi:dimethylglycine dehydrogenase